MSDLIFVALLQMLLTLSLSMTAILICAIGVINLLELSDRKAKAESFPRTERPRFVDDVNLREKLRWIRRIMAEAPRNPDGAIKTYKLIR